MAIVADGVYAIDASWLEAAGIDRAGLDMRKVRVFGNGGEQLPYRNEVERPLDLQEVAVVREGGADGIWHAGDRILFYGKGPVSWSRSAPSSRWP
jgi:hypothetical protein